MVLLPRFLYFVRVYSSRFRNVEARRKLTRQLDHDDGGGGCWYEVVGE